jgi:RimJ/RimL family protein N-acetyltransferase
VIELRGDHVVLRGFRAEEVAVALERMQSVPPAELDRDTLRERRERLERSGERNGSEIMLAVEADGRLVGDVQGRCPRFALPPGVWELGIELWDSADRGRGIGRETVALLSSYLFEREDAIRVQATTMSTTYRCAGCSRCSGSISRGSCTGSCPTRRARRATTRCTA